MLECGIIANKIYLISTSDSCQWKSEFLHRAADLTLVPSAAIGKDLEAARVTAGENRGTG